jgi:hypothetical protein
MKVTKWYTLMLPVLTYTYELEEWEDGPCWGWTTTRWFLALGIPLEVTIIYRCGSLVNEM